MAMQITAVLLDNVGTRKKNLCWLERSQKHNRREIDSVSIQYYGTRPGCSFKLQSLFCYKSSKCSLTLPHMRFTAGHLTIQNHFLAPCTWCNCICTLSYSFVMAWLSIEFYSHRKPLSFIGKGWRGGWWRIRIKFNNSWIANFLPGSHWTRL